MFNTGYISESQHTNAYDCFKWIIWIWNKCFILLKCCLDSYSVLCDTKRNTIPQNKIHSTWCALATCRNFYSIYYFIQFLFSLVCILQVKNQKQKGVKVCDEGCTHSSSTAANRTQLPGTSSEPLKLVRSTKDDEWLLQQHWLFKIILKERITKSWVVGRSFCFVFGRNVFPAPFSCLQSPLNNPRYDILSMCVMISCCPPFRIVA